MKHRGLVLCVGWKGICCTRTRNRPLCDLKTRKTGTGFYACPLFAILKMLLSLRRRHGTASRKHNPYQYRIFSQGNSVCAYIAFETHIRCKTDNFALFASPNKKSNLHCPPTKRELAGYDAGIHATDNESLKADLQAAFDRKSVLLKKRKRHSKTLQNKRGLSVTGRESNPMDSISLFHKKR